MPAKRGKSNSNIRNPSTDTDYRSWKLRVAEALEHRGLSELVLGQEKCPKAAQFNSIAVYHRQVAVWQERDATAKRLLVDKCNNQMIGRVRQRGSAQKVWREIDKIYGNTSRLVDHVFETQDLCSLAFDPNNVDNFVSQFGSRVCAIKMSRPGISDATLLGVLLDKIEPWYGSFASGLKLEIALVALGKELPRVRRVLQDLKQAATMSKKLNELVDGVWLPELVKSQSMEATGGSASMSLIPSRNAHFSPSALQYPAVREPSARSNKGLASIKQHAAEEQRHETREYQQVALQKQDMNFHSVIVNGPPQDTEAKYTLPSRREAPSQQIGSISSVIRSLSTLDNVPLTPQVDPSLVARDRQKLGMQSKRYTEYQDYAPAKRVRFGKQRTDVGELLSDSQKAANIAPMTHRAAMTFQSDIILPGRTNSRHRNTEASGFAHNAVRTPQRQPIPFPRRPLFERERFPHYIAAGERQELLRQKRAQATWINPALKKQPLPSLPMAGIAVTNTNSARFTPPNYSATSEVAQMVSLPSPNIKLAATPVVTTADRSQYSSIITDRAPAGQLFSNARSGMHNHLPGLSIGIEGVDEHGSAVALADDVSDADKMLLCRESAAK